MRPDALHAHGVAGPSHAGLMSPTRLQTERATVAFSLRDIKPQRQRGTKIPPNLESRFPLELRTPIMNNPDQDTVIRAVEDARRILGEYIEPGPRDATRTVERLLAVLDRNDVVHALDRITRRRVIRLVK